MNEASKALRRRKKEHRKGGFNWEKLFKGRGIDVGCGPDKLPFPNCQPFDLEHGDANELHKYFPENTFDYLHSSQSLEHMVDPAKALANWIRVVKPGGALVVTIPSWELYEGMQWPSRYNPDHKSTWSMWQKGSPAPFHCKMPEWLNQFKGVKILLCRLVDDNYDYSIGTSKDQTWVEADGVEAFIEFVLQKE